MKAKEHLKELHRQRIRAKGIPERNVESFIKPYKNKNKELRILSMCEDFCSMMPKTKMNRIDNTGKRVDNRKTYVNTLGHNVTVGSVSWQRSQMQNGISDLVGMINGRFVAAELKRVYKNGKDRQSKAQKQYQKEVEEAGGIYIIFADFEDFYEQFMKIYE